MADTDGPDMLGPRQPAPCQPSSAPVAPAGRPAAPTASDGRPQGRFVLIAAGAVLTLLLLVVAGVAIFSGDPDSGQQAVAAASAPAAAVTSASLPATPADRAQLTLQQQSKALIAGDEPGWLAAVDPSATAARAFFQHRYRLLRVLHVSHYTAEFDSLPYTEPGTGTFTAQVLSGYCFSLNSCPPIVGSDSSQQGAPKIRETMTFRRVGDRYLISAIDSGETGRLQPTPWQAGDLSTAEGRRVTVAAAPGARWRLRDAVVAGDRAATVVDRFAARFGNPQLRYRVYLADNTTWKQWFGTEPEPHVDGHAIPLNNVQTDVVINTNAIKSDTDFAVTIQHELGHVASVGNRSRDGTFVLAVFDKWLVEGIAEYIAYYPHGAAASPRRTGVRALLHSPDSPRSVRGVVLGGSLRADDQFYGYSHYTIDCLTHLYGQQRMITFVSQALRRHRSIDEASRQAFGKPFDDIDQRCVTWIRQHA